MGIPGWHTLHEDSHTWPEILGMQSGGCIRILGADWTKLLFLKMPAMIVENSAARHTLTILPLFR